MANWCINSLNITLPASIGLNLMESLEKVQRGEDPLEGDANPAGLFRDIELNEARTAAGVGLLELLAPRYTFSDSPSIYGDSVDPYDIWGAPDVAEFDIMALRHLPPSSSGVPLVGITILFHSRWSPPIAAIDKFMDLVPEANITFFYVEPGDGFFGERVKLDPEVANVSEPISRYVHRHLGDFYREVDNRVEEIYYPSDSELLNLAEEFECTFDMMRWLLSQFADTIHDFRRERVENEEDYQNYGGEDAEKDAGEE